jgi:hypothetical protein
VFDHRIRSDPLERDVGDVAEIVDSNKLHEPLRGPGFSRRYLQSVVSLPVVKSLAADVVNRRDGIALYVCTSDNPTQASPDRENEDDQFPNAESKPSPRNT